MKFERRWGHGVVGLLLVSLIIFPRQAHECHAFEAAAGVDSALVASFLDMPQDSLTGRKQQAEDLAKQALRTKNGLRRRLLQTEAATVFPAEAQFWLDLATTELDMGYVQAAENSLAAARVTIDFLRGEQRRAAVREYSLAKGWWYLHEGHWQKGLSWGRRAVKYDAGQAGHLLVGLSSAQIQDTFSDLQSTCRVFRPINSGGNRRANMSWCYLLHFYFHKFPFDEIDAIYWLDRSTHHSDHDALRWRDYGLHCEANRAGTSAKSYYEKSARAVVAKEGGWLTRRTRIIPTVASPMPALPFWTNPHEGYVTGSLLAYLGFVQDQMVTSKSTSERNVWAERLLAAYGRTYRRCPGVPWPTLWQSEALMYLGQLKEAKSEIRYARNIFQSQGCDEPNVDRVHGHLLLMQKKYGQAAPMIEAAVAAFPQNATCWVDLGLVNVHGNDTVAARAAFDQALLLDSELAVAWYNRGLLKLRGGHPQEALADIERAAELVPGNAQINKDLIRIGQLITNKTKQQ